MNKPRKVLCQKCQQEILTEGICEMIHGNFIRTSYMCFECGAEYTGYYRYIGLEPVNWVTKEVLGDE